MKKVKAAKICNIDFYKSSSKKLCTGNKKNSITFSTKAQQEQFLTSIQNTDAVCLSSFSDFCSSFIPSLPAPPKFKLPIDFRTLYQPDVNFDERKMYALSSLSITKEETQHLEQLTTEQSNSVTWNQFRVGRITSSVVHRVLHTDFNHPSKSLNKPSVALQSQYQYLQYNGEGKRNLKLFINILKSCLNIILTFL